MKEKETKKLNKNKFKKAEMKRPKLGEVIGFKDILISLIS